MAPRETENNTYAKVWGDKQGTLWYVVVFSEVVSWVIYIGMPVVWTERRSVCVRSRDYQNFSDKWIIEFS